MANVCESKITIIGLKEPAEVFVKALSKAMFGIDLDNMNPKQWGEDESIDGKTWYASLVTEFRQQRHARYCVLYPHFSRLRLGRRVRRPSPKVRCRKTPPERYLGYSTLRWRPGRRESLHCVRRPGMAADSIPAQGRSQTGPCADRNSSALNVHPCAASCSNVARTCWPRSCP